MKTNLIIAVIAASILMGLIFSTLFYKNKYDNQLIENTTIKKNFTELNSSYYSLANSYQKLLNQKTYSISLAPTIDTKVTSTFGSTKYITLQYYFTMDGNKLELKPDSVYTLSKENN